MPDLVKTHTSDGVVTVVLNRPAVRNALSPELIEALGAAIGRIEADPAARSVVLGGAGRAFCAGMDVKAVINDPAGMGRMLAELSRILRRIRRLGVPTIAAVQGAAMGGGGGLLAVADLVLLHSQARIGFPEVSLGLCPAVVAPWVIRKVGPGRARGLLLSGLVLTGRDALEAGLADRISDAGPEDLLAEAAAWAGRLAEGGPQAISTTKRWLNELDGSNEEAPFDRGAELSGRIAAGDEARARMRQKFGT